MDQSVANSFSNVGRFIPSEGCGGDKSKTYCEEDERYPDLGDITPKLTEKQLGILKHKEYDQILINLLFVFSLCKL